MKEIIGHALKIKWSRVFNFSILISCSLLLSLTSCTKIIECWRKDCQNGAVCHEGECVCPIGYQGELCETYVKHEFWHTAWITETFITTRGIENCLDWGPYDQFDGKIYTFSQNAQGDELPGDTIHLAFYQSFHCEDEGFFDENRVIAVLKNNYLFSVPEQVTCNGVKVISGKGRLGNRHSTVDAFKVENSMHFELDFIILGDTIQCTAEMLRLSYELDL